MGQRTGGSILETKKILYKEINPNYYKPKRGSNYRDEYLGQDIQDLYILKEK